MADNKNRVVLTPSRIFTYGILVKNPILVQVIGLCPAVAACADIYVATVLSSVILILLFICEFIASVFLKKTSPWIRTAIYFAVGLLVSSGATVFCEMNIPQIANTAGIYLPLMAASSAAALRCENFAVKKSLRLSVYDALANGIGTALVLLFTGFVRGLLGVGMIGDIVVFEKAPISGLSMPFGGFIMLGFSAAALKWFISSFLSDYSHDMSFGIKRTKKKSPVTPNRETKAFAQNEKPKEEIPASKEEKIVKAEKEEIEAFEEKPAPSNEFLIEEFSLTDEIDALFADIDGIGEDGEAEKEDSDE